MRQTVISYLIFASVITSSTNELIALEKKKIEPVDEWIGEIEAVPAGMGDSQVITDEKTLAKWWKDAAPKGKSPVIDFKNDFVVILYARGSSMDVSAVLDNGELTVVGETSKDSPPGVRYSIALFHRAGIKKVNEKPLK